MRLQLRLALMLASLLCAFHLSNASKFGNNHAHPASAQSENRPMHPKSSDNGHAHPAHKDLVDQPEMVENVHRKDSPKVHKPFAGDQSRATANAVDKEEGESMEKENKSDTNEAEYESKDSKSFEDLVDGDESEEDRDSDERQDGDSGARKTGTIKDIEPKESKNTKTEGHNDRHQESGRSHSESSGNRPASEHKKPSQEHARRHNTDYPTHQRALSGHEQPEHDYERQQDDQERPEPDNARDGPPNVGRDGLCTLQNMVEMFMEQRKIGDNKNDDIDLLIDFVLLLARREAGRMGDDMKRSEEWWHVDLMDVRHPLSESGELRPEIDRTLDHGLPDAIGSPSSNHARAEPDLRQSEHDDNGHQDGLKRQQPDIKSPDSDSVRDGSPHGPPHGESHGPCTFDMVKMLIERKKKCNKKKTDMDLLTDITLLIMEREAGRMGDDDMTDSDHRWHSEMKKDDWSRQFQNLHSHMPSFSDRKDRFPSLFHKESATEDTMGSDDWPQQKSHEDNSFDNRDSDKGHKDFFDNTNEDQSRTATSGKDWFHGPVDSENYHNGMHSVRNEHTQMEINRMLDEFHEIITSKSEQEGDEEWSDLKGWAKSKIWPIIKMQGKGKDRFEENDDPDRNIEEKMDVMLDEFKEKCIIEKDHERLGQEGRKEWLALKRWMMFKIWSLIKLSWRGDEWTGKDWFGMGHGREHDGSDGSAMWNKFHKDNNDNIQGKTADLKQKENGSSKFGGSLGLLTTVAILVISKAFFL